jgi:hypothetical protein
MAPPVLLWLFLYLPRPNSKRRCWRCGRRLWGGGGPQLNAHATGGDLHYEGAIGVRTDSTESDGAKQRCHARIIGGTFGRGRRKRRVDFQLRPARWEYVVRCCFACGKYTTRGSFFPTYTTFGCQY